MTAFLLDLAERGQNTLLGAELTERAELIKEQLAVYAELEDKRAELRARKGIRSGEGYAEAWPERWGERPDIRDDSYSSLDERAFDLALEAQEILDILVPLLTNEEF